MRFIHPLADSSDITKARHVRSPLALRNNTESQDQQSHDADPRHQNPHQDFTCTGGTTERSNVSCPPPSTQAAKWGHSYVTKRVKARPPRCTCGPGGDAHQHGGAPFAPAAIVVRAAANPDHIVSDGEAEEHQVRLLQGVFHLWTNEMKAF